eukprot:336067-Chlamydomonas_euryale.AAC.1
MRVNLAVQGARHASSSGLFTTTACTASSLPAARVRMTAAAAAAAGSAGGAAPPSAEEAELLRVIEAAPKDVERVKAALEPLVASAGGGGEGGSLLPTLGGEWAVSWWEGAAQMASRMQQPKDEGSSEEQVWRALRACSCS